jgi:hypothetical protein
MLALGLWPRAHDWDLTTDAPPARVRRALRGAGATWHGPSGIHADRKWVMARERVEIIVRFALRSRVGVARIPTRVAGRWRGVPLGSAEAWAVAYALMGRRRKARVLWDHLGRVGADPSLIRALARRALPAALRRRLRALPLRSAREGAARTALSA